MAAASAAVIIVCIAGLSVWLLFTSEPYTLPPGQDPQLILPLYDYSHLNIIQGYGQVSPDRFHPGFDFGVNDTTIIVASYDAYVTDISLWYNERGGHWQVNMDLKMNSQCRIRIAFESWALNETYGQLQLEAINVTVGQRVSANQSLGMILCHGSGAHIHFGLYYNDDYVCPYSYFTAEAKTVFEVLYSVCGNPPDDWCIT